MSQVNDPKPGFILKLDDDSPNLEVPGESREEIAKELYEVEKSDYCTHLKFQESIGITAVRSLFLMNAGAIIGILTFIGNHGADVVAVSIRTSIALFVGGVVSAAAALIPAYLAQFHFQETARRQMIDMLRHRVGSVPANDHLSWAKKGDVRIKTAFVFLVLSLILFCLGALVGINALVLKGPTTF